MRVHLKSIESKELPAQEPSFYFRHIHAIIGSSEKKKWKYVGEAVTFFPNHDII